MLYPIHGLEENIVTMFILPQIIHRFYVIQFKIPARFFFFFVEMNKLILKCTWKCKDLRILKKEEIS